MRFKSFKVKQKINRAVSILLMAGFLIAVGAAEGKGRFSFFEGEKVYATSAEDRRDEAQQNLDDVEDEINSLQSQQSEVENELSEKAAVLSDLLAEQRILEDDIEETQVAIDQAKVDLEVAKAKEEEEYEAMKLRIQYMYENSAQDSMWMAIFESDGIADMLNRVEYVTQVHKTDRELLAAYKETVVQVEELAAKLESEMNDLTTMQEVLAHQEVELEAAMAELEAEAADFEVQLASAQQRADAYAAEVARQNEIIRQEELRREQERLEQERRQQQQQQQQASGNNSSGSGTGGGSSTSKPSVGGSSYLNDASYDPAFTSGVSGTDLVNYALQFVGNPYKWGGNSLTDGCDCSGFVNLVYKHFGFSVPRYSQAFRSVGQPVAYQNLKAGDIVVYPGHVAIYIGNGKIVEAQSTKAGITSYRSVNCSTITAIRRVL
uniref:NlpC/P60 family protein n=1 Tax=Agathobacter sp. TaxID=2021311 RepID=UPI004056F3B9